MSKTLVTTAAMLALAMTASLTSGCGLMHRGKKLYTGSAQSRPLEVPPELDASAPSDAGVSAMRSATAAQVPQTAASTGGFVVAGTRDEVFNRVGEALAKIDGVTIASRAQLLGAFDVSYAGSNFLVRVAPAAGGMQVSAVDPRGLPTSGDAPRKLIDALRAALAP